MGYRSEVAFRVETKTEDDLQSVIEKLKNKWAVNTGFKWEDFILDMIVYDYELVLHGNDLKWYDGYEDVSAVMDWFWELVDDYRDNKDTVISGIQYIRLGEDPEDVEEIWHGDLYNPMSLIRSIDLGQECIWKLKSII